MNSGCSAIKAYIPAVCQNLSAVIGQLFPSLGSAGTLWLVQTGEFWKLRNPPIKWTKMLDYTNQIDVRHFELRWLAESPKISPDDSSPAGVGRSLVCLAWGGRMAWLVSWGGVYGRLIRPVWPAKAQSQSWKFSGLKGLIPVHRNPACILFGVAASGNAVLTRLNVEDGHGFSRIQPHPCIAGCVHLFKWTIHATIQGLQFVTTVWWKCKKDVIFFGVVYCLHGYVWAVVI